MKSTNINIKGMTKTWLIVLRENCVKFNIRVTRGDLLPLQQTNDIYIGEIPTYTNFTLEPTDQRLFRKCHCHLHLTTVTDMANAAGTHLRPGMRVLSPQAGSISIFNWHLGQIPITKQHRTLWNRIMNKIALDNSTKLQCKLGPWTTLPSMSPPHRLHQQALYIQQSNGL